MGGLVFLELRYALHRAQAILRSPARLLVWAPYLAFVCYIAVSRIVRGHRGGPAFDVLPAYTTVIAGSYLAIFGVTAALAAGGRVAGFRSPAEAVLFSNAGLRPLTIAVWLQLRKLASSPMRWLGGFVYLFAVAAPKDTSPLAIARALILVALLVALSMAIELPAFLLGRGRPRIPVIAGGWALAAIGGGYAVAGLLGARALTSLYDVTHVDPGAAVHALLHGDAATFAAILAVLAALGASVFYLGDDALPELYAAALGARAARAARARNRPATDGDYVTSGTARGGRIPAGSLSLIWKDWLAFRRARGSLRLWILGAIAWTACGVAVGYAKIAWADASPIFTMVAGSAVLVLVLAPFNASVGLANDLSKPLFWLNAAPLDACIAAWTAGRSWRGGAVLALAPTAAGIVTGDVTLALFPLPIALAGYWSLQALGVGFYALFPDPIDARGPMLIVRLLVTAVYLAPASIACALTSLVPGFDAVAALLATAILLLQGYFTIVLATNRFREHGASLATISRS